MIIMGLKMEGAAGIYKREEVTPSNGNKTHLPGEIGAPYHDAFFQEKLKMNVNRLCRAQQRN